MGASGTSQIIILTGGRGVGKTTVCQRAVAFAAARRYRCGGIVTPSTSPDARTVLDVGSGQERRLTRNSAPEGLLRIGRFRFDPTAFAWGNDVLANALPCDLLVVDELGPLEFERGQGLMAAFGVLREDGYSLAIVVVRPELVARACTQFQSEDVTVLEVTVENRDVLPETVAGMLERLAGSSVQGWL